MRQRRLIAIAVGMIAVAAIVVVRATRGDSSTSATTTTTATTATTAATPTTRTPIAPDRFDQIGSVTFVDATHGWLLATRHSDQKAELLHTVDGTTWTAVHTMPLADDRRSAFGTVFADRQDGWIWGDGWWSTHDGGATWTRLPDGQGGFSPSLLYLSGGMVYGLSFDDDPRSRTFQRYALIRSPVDHDAFVPTGLFWTKGAEGNDIAASIASQAGVVFVSFNDLGARVGRIVGDRADASWRPIGLGRGGDIALAAAPEGGPLYLTTETGHWGGDPTRTLIVAKSLDHGITFDPIALPVAPPDRIDPRFCGLDAPDATTVVASLCDATGTTLYSSHDEGVTWASMSHLPPSAGRVQFHTAQVVTVRLSDTAGAQLWLSTDGGRDWHQASL